MNEELRNLVGSFILGVIITTLYFTVPASDLVSAYVSGILASLVLVLLAGYLGAKNISQKNKKYNENCNSSATKPRKEERVFPILLKKFSLSRVILFLASSWIGALVLVALLAKHVKENNSLCKS